MTEGRDFVYRLSSGFLIGLGLVIPGVSGAILAMILGLYQPIIAAVAKPFVNWRQNLKLLVPLGIGAGSCLLLFSRLLEYLFAQHPMPTLYFFFGLVLGGLPTVVNLANRRGFRLSYIVSLSGGLALLFMITSLPKIIGGEATFAQGLLGFVFQGSLVGVGLVVPGLSASFLLMAFGFYEELLRAVAHLNIPTLAPLALGFVPTIILVSRGINRLLQRQYGHTSYVILGLLLASLRVAFPGWPRTGLELVICLSLFGAGIWLSSFFRTKTHST